MSKASLRWRTALILRELEAELEAIDALAPTEEELARLMAAKEGLERRQRSARLELQRERQGYGERSGSTPAQIEAELEELRARSESLDARIGPLARASAEAFNERWGTPLRAGYDISHLARQIERSADIYTSRVSNLLYATPFAYLRAKRGSMPHD
jgi:hypothetical protein